MTSVTPGANRRLGFIPRGEVTVLDSVIDPWFSQSNPNPAQPLEKAERTAADVRWLDSAFAKAEADNAHSVVIFGQADMWDTSDAAAHQTNYEPIIAAMGSNTQM